MSADDDTHECPAPDCAARVPFHLLACRQHWRLVPGFLSRPLNAAWRAGDVAAHVKARQDIVDWFGR